MLKENRLDGDFLMVNIHVYIHCNDYGICSVCNVYSVFRSVSYSNGKRKNLFVLWNWYVLNYNVSTKTITNKAYNWITETEVFSVQLSLYAKKSSIW